jgi:tungstate transport system substrate-binding protein
MSSCGNNRRHDLPPTPAGRVACRPGRRPVGGDCAAASLPRRSAARRRRPRIERLRPGPPLLDGLERGEFDATLTNAPAAEGRLDEQGLAHDRHAIARGEFLIVGPRPRPKEKDVAAIAGLTQAAEALIQIRNAALAMPGTITFLSAGDGSGAHVLEQALWRQAKLGPTPPWYLQAERGSGLIAQARARGAYAVVERGAWVAEGGGPLAMLVERDPALAESVQVLRAFRVNHPAGKIFVAWITGPKGQRVVAAQRAYRVA